MSLGDLNKNVNKGAGSLYANQKGRIMREADEHNKMIEMREIDRIKQGVARKEADINKMGNEIAKLRREIIASTSKMKMDPADKRLIQDKERKIAMLEMEQRQISDGIKKNQAEIRFRQMKFRA